MIDSSHTLTPFASRVYGTAVIAAPLLLMASTVAYLVEGEGINHGILGGVIGAWSGFTMAIAMMAVLRLVEPKAPRAATLLTVVALIGFSAGMAFNVTAVLETVAGFDDAIEAAIAVDPVALLAWLPWGVLAPTSFVLIGIALWRTGTSAWSGGLLVAGGVLFVVGRMERIGALALVTDGVLILALAPIGWAMLTGARTAAASRMRHAR